MCGTYVAINNPFMQAQTRALLVPDVESGDIRVPASSIQVIHENKTANSSCRMLSDAKWWLLLNSDGSANYKYASFNSR
ncbi:MAG TPA: hypothetical protein ENJ41_09050 [Oceanospirillales bacterium]|nr:hypothetical protein [Oceanospirillales bacterium]